MTEYSVGFAFDDCGHVALIKKNRPKWQKGKFNGIGGHVEEGETPSECMVREFREECGLVTTSEQWRHYAMLVSERYEVAVFVARDIDLHDVKTMTDEEIVVFRTNAVPFHLCVPNLQWLIPLALCSEAERLPGEGGTGSKLVGVTAYYE